MDYEKKDLYKDSILQLLNRLYKVFLGVLAKKENKIDADTDIRILQTDRAQGVFTVEQKRVQMKQSLRDDMFKMVYSMIRTAKFISGEEVKDE